MEDPKSLTRKHKRKENRQTSENLSSVIAFHKQNVREYGKFEFSCLVMSAWGSLGFGRECRLLCVRSVLTTSVLLLG